MTKKENTKAEQKVAAAAVHDKSLYEDTAFGRRRISRTPKTFAVLIWLVGMPAVYIYHHLRRLHGGW